MKTTTVYEMSSGIGLEDLQIRSGSDVFELNGPDLFADTADSLRGMQPASTMGARSVALSMDAWTADVTITAATGVGVSKLAMLLDLMEQSITGSRFIVLAAMADTSRWYQHATCIKAVPAVTQPGVSAVKLTIAMLDGVWWSWQPRSIMFMPASDTAGLDFPFDLPANLGMSLKRDAFTTSSGVDTWPVFRISGPADNPSIVIDGNTYAVDVSIPAGSTLVIDTAARTVTMGGRNLFSKAHRGSGLDGGEYIFQPLSGDRHQIAYSGLRFSLTPMTRRAIIY